MLKADKVRYMNKVICGDALTVLKTLPDDFVDCCVTSPPYWGLRDYQVDGQLGLEKTPEEYVEKMVEIFREVKRVLKPDGTCWLNLGDSYASGKSRYSSVEQTIAGHGRNEPINGNRPDLKNHAYIKDKDLVGIPWMVALALRADGWWLRQDIIWSKPNPTPESVKDRCTKSHEYIFLLTKSANYYYDYEAILEPANYDGRLATMMKGSPKYANGFTPEDNPNTMAIMGHERWSRKIAKNAPADHRGVNDKTEKNYGLRGFKTKSNLEVNPSYHGTNIMGHSGNFNADGEPNMSFTDEGVTARNKRDVWHIATKPYAGAHFATFPPELIRPCVQTTRPDAIILDPFMGSCTTAQVAIEEGRNYLGIELNPDYIKLGEKRIKDALERTRQLTIGE